MKKQTSLYFDSDELVEKINEDAKKQDRKPNYIINQILKKHYKIKETKNE